MFYFIRKIMSKRKRKRTTKRTHTPKRVLSARRRKRSRPRKGLSEAFTPASAMDAGRGILSGGLGGSAIAVIERFIPNGTSPLTEAAIKLGASFLTHAVAKMPQTAAGMSGAFFYEKTKQFFTKIPMNDDTDTPYADPDALNEFPILLNEDGQPMMLSDDGQYYVLDEPTMMGLMANGATFNPYAMSEQFTPVYSLIH